MFGDFTTQRSNRCERDVSQFQTEAENWNNANGHKKLGIAHTTKQFWGVHTLWCNYLEDAGLTEIARRA
jgi:hypothetical protein